MLLAAALLGVGCQRVDPRAEGTGDLVLRFASGAEGTKSSASPSLADGDLFQNLLVIVADANGQVVQRKYIADVADKSVETVSFEDLKVGPYLVFAYANITHGDWLAAGQGVEAVEKTVATVDSTRTLAPLAQLSAPDNATGMLLTGKKQVFVGASQNAGSVELCRPVVRFNVYVRNHTDRIVRLNSMSFSDFNARTASLLPRRGSDGERVVPTVEYQPMPAFGYPSGIDIPAATAQGTGEQLVYSQLLYENEAGIDYRLFANVTREGNTKDLKTQGARLLSYEEIASLGEGMSVQVLMVNPTTSGGLFFGWDPDANEGNGALITETARYNFKEPYLKKADELMQGTHKDKFILTLKKQDGKYRLIGLGDKDLFTAVPIRNSASVSAGTGLTLAEKLDPQGASYPISPDFNGYLCRFRDANSTPKYLYSNTNLYVTNGSAGEGNRMWAFYEVNPLGAVLKHIDSETSQVTAISRMLRGQELNVVLNVYYQSVEGDLGIVVDNSTWSGEGQTSTHMFE